MLSERTLFSATVINEVIYAVGGYSGQGMLASPFIEFFKEGSWQELKTTFVQRAGHQSIKSEYNKLVIFGGQTKDDQIDQV